MEFQRCNTIGLSIFVWLTGKRTPIQRTGTPARIGGRVLESEFGPGSNLRRKDGGFDG